MPVNVHPCFTKMERGVGNELLRSSLTTIINTFSPFIQSVDLVLDTSKIENKLKLGDLSDPVVPRHKSVFATGNFVIHWLANGLA